ncbi:uncharacterized protein BX664DRAFT_313605 [Halteromyces radiatus]|uniref:uncharacterized protein n=1 Tax=Halteromyces radiatus TaxID=101107 RepID=UPI00221E6523|nr:uncharacterized protein BX664DRAFT_313605 [Halteromyces radiatus]KAI8093563.1 hypothetical protein BX664DRAFT_313605 [Halteromyces radiatus]
MTESMSQTQLVEDTNRFGKHKGIRTSLSSNGTSSTPICTVIFQPHSTQFPVKTIELKDNVKCRIGRQSSAKTIPKPLNGYFDSKVLSRNHALLWLSEGKIYIKDTKSSNGTFLNGHRLSPELEESEPFELKTGDQIEFGIDITGEDGTVLYHKVACTISIIHLPVDQMDHATLKEFNLSTNYASLFSSSDMEMQQSRRSSTSSVATISYHTGKNTITDQSSNPSLNLATKRSKNWELLIGKLESELQRSQQVEKELLDMKEFIGDVDKVNNEDRLKKMNDLNISLQHRLNEAQQQLTAYAEKTRLQDLAVASAQKQLLELQQVIETSRKAGMAKLNYGPEMTKLRQTLEQVRFELDQEKVKHNKALMAEKKRAMDYEKKCLELEKHLLFLERDQRVNGTTSVTRSDGGGFFSGLMDALQIRSVQIVFGVMMAVISTLLYLLLMI